ncbi:hypothetical protein HMPREF1249_1047 [Jonquetella sp. BV3C21]|nr:hypothetical protein HMPREF1249_1047 [Jonquetella sp. BV3C21]
MKIFRGHRFARLCRDEADADSKSDKNKLNYSAASFRRKNRRRPLLPGGFFKDKRIRLPYAFVTVTFPVHHCALQKFFLL